MARAAFPLELVVHVLRYVHSESTLKDRQTLVSCSLVSYAWHELTLPFLFREVSFKYENDPYDAGYDEDQKIGLHLREAAAAAKKRAVVPSKAKRLTRFFLFLHSRSAIAQAIHELHLLANHFSSPDNCITDVGVFVAVLQSLPNLHILHVTDVLFDGPLNDILQTCRYLDYRPLSLDKLHYTLTVNEYHTKYLFGRSDFVNEDRVIWLIGLFMRIGELHLYKLQDVHRAREPSLLPRAPRVERIIAHSMALCDTCHVLRGIDPQAIRHMDLGEIGPADVSVIADLLAGAVNLEHLSFGILWLSVESTNALPASGKLRSQRLQAITIRSADLNDSAMQVLANILRSLSSHLDASPEVPLGRYPITVHLMFCENPTETRFASTTLERMVQSAYAINRNYTAELDRTLLRLTSSHHGVSRVKLRLSHGTLNGEEWRHLAGLVLPSLGKMNVELD
ncbi:hypothetical protein NM688_g3522 [Phlebia brevispora]|uniref:Uncharacterized protein n=1 Tax=Phlebia brevispora TaxID=194682 RepID=A0ACC1T5B0_9APHY|nr:hypothetical protein NM688_g3522 [Phlebia brevispora]